LTDEEALGRCREIPFVFAAVERLLRERNLGTFGHMILHAHRLLAEDRSLLARERARARFILVDEFQDANFAQIAVLKQLAGENEPNVFAVGDPDQGIYRFRGASSDAFELFQKQFAGSKLVVLDQNRRSTTPVLKCAYALVSRNPEFCLQADGKRYSRMPLVSARDREEAEKGAQRAAVEAVLVSGALMEAAELVATIAERRRRWRCDWKDFAVLYRSHVHREEVAAELARNEIPFTIEALDVMDTPEVRDVLACLGAVVSPADSASLFRVAALRRFQVAAEELRTVMHAQPRDSKITLAEILPKVSGGPEVLQAVERARAEVAGEKAHAALFTLSRVFGLPRNPALQALLNFASAWEKLPITETGGPGEFLEYLEHFREARGVIPLQ